MEKGRFPENAGAVSELRDAMDGLIEMHELTESFKTLQLNR